MTDWPTEHRDHHLHQDGDALVIINIIIIIIINTRRMEMVMGWTTGAARSRFPLVFAPWMQPHLTDHPFFVSFLFVFLLWECNLIWQMMMILSIIQEKRQHLHLVVYHLGERTAYWGHSAVFIIIIGIGKLNSSFFVTSYIEPFPCHLCNILLLIVELISIKNKYILFWY